MKKAPIPVDEEQRLLELQNYEILDTPVEQAFDDITRMASLICGTPISLISLIDKDRQWFKSRHGIDATETPRDISWCGHAIMEDEIFEIQDSTKDERFHDNPFVENPGVRYYAGAPLKTPQGFRIGTLCVIHHQPHVLNDMQKEFLKTLARQAVMLIEARLKEKKLEESNAKLDAIVNNIPVMIASYKADGEYEWVNKTWIKELGWNFEEMNRLNMMEEFYPNPFEREEAMKFMQEPNGQWQEFHTRRKDGSYVHTTWTSLPMPDGKFIAIGKNINERKLFTARLLKKNIELQSYETALNKYAIVARTDASGKIKYVNDKFCEISKFSREELIGKDHRILNSRTHSKEFFAYMWGEISSGRPWRGQIKNRAKDGSFYWVDTTIAPIYDGSRIGEYIAFRYDITYDIQNELVTKAISNMRAAYIGADGDTQRIHKIILNSLLSLTESNYGLVYSFEDQRFPLTQARLDNEEWSIDYQSIVEQVKMQYRPSTFKRGDVTYYALPIFNNLQLNAVIILGNRDSIISDSMFHALSPFLAVVGEILVHNRLNLEAEENQSMLEMLAYASELGLWDWNLETNEVHFSDRYCEMLGYQRSEVKQHLSFWEENLHPDDLEHSVKGYQDYIEGRSQIYEVRFRMKHKLGHWVPILTKGKIIRTNETGKPTRFAGTHFDLTNIAAMEAKLEYQRKITQHQAKLASIGQLAAGVGHEINNPLAIIKGYLHNIEDDLKEINIEDKHIFHMLGKINIATERIVNIVKGLRTFSRSDTDQLTSFSAKEAIEESYFLIKDIYQKEGIEISLFKDDKEMRIFGNRGRFQQVIVNLFSNAKDATEGRDERQISLSIKEILDHVVIEIADNGKGIPVELREKIFEPFFTTKDVNKGTGIGLSLVSSIIKELDGQITVESPPGQGARFVITLPLDKSLALKRDSNLVTPELTFRRGLKILIADDEADIRNIVSNMLKNLEMNVTAVGNGQRALEALEKDKFDLLITDLKMPELDGKSLITQLLHSDWHKPDIIVMTGGVDDQLESFNLENHKFVLLPKPFSENDLRAKLSAIFPTFFKDPIYAGGK